MKKMMLILIVFSLLSMSFVGCPQKFTGIKIVDENGSPVSGAQVIFCDENGREQETIRSDGLGVIYYENEKNYVFIKVVPPEGFELVETDYLQGVKISGEGSSKISMIVFRPKSGSMTATATTSTSTTTQSTATTSTTSVSSTSTLLSTTTTETTTSAKAEPFVLYPDNVNSLYGYNPGTESAALIQDYIDRELLLLYKNSNGASRVLIEFALDQPALREWVNSVESYSAYLVLQRTPETLNRQQQATIYSVDMEAWQSQTSSTPPHSPYIDEFSYNFQDLLVSQLDPMGPDIVAVWDQIHAGTQFAGADSSGKLDIISWSPENVNAFTVEGATGNLDLLIDTPGGTQMTPGTEMAWYDSAAIIFFQNP